MGTVLKQKKDLIKVKQFVTNSNGRKVAAIIEMEELKRLEELIEDMADIKAIEDRKNEPSEDYEAYSKKRRSKLSV
ncbi:MAG: hypothetical protein AYP45_10175 [Candidatus Brocadia carolinensis]|uniref:Antitoxin n=1 Tax=Candidatus Brocadia carolinensis TaxID=1004156 RepID=A0A1V4AT72_9BACT|nr:MAG: hypothetical protein AYP45_10175 [Candidatus Brocadia caroliniensis]